MENSNNQLKRNFGPTTWALKNANTIFLLILILGAFGFYTYRSLPKELFPDIVIPTVMVQTIYPGNSPLDIENLITRELEKEIESVKGIKKMTSLSSQDVSSIFVEFNTDIDIKTALQDVKDAVDKAKSNLPDNLLDDPMVSDIDFSEFPIININLSGDFSINELKNFAELLEDEIEAFSEISKVEITGITEREVKIMVDPYKLQAVELSFNDIETAIKNENLSMSGGEILTGSVRRALSISGEFTDVREIGNIIIKHEDQNIVYLRDVADVDFGFEEPTSFARLDHQPVVSLQVVKKSGENLLNATEKIFRLIDQARNENLLPSNLRLTVTNDQSEQIKLQLSNLENSMIMGIIFVVFVLFFFMGTRNAVFVGISIPLSMFISFVVMGILDYQINMIVLFSLILALGMLVDNAIVVVENIYRFIEEGKPIGVAAREAVGEIAVPIISSTATTLAAFFPLLFWQSIIGEFMKYLPMTLIITLSSSLFTALVLVPVIMQRFFKNEDPIKRPNSKKSLIIAGVMLLLSVPFFIAGNNTPGSLLVIFALIGLSNLLFLNRFARWFQLFFLVWLEKAYLYTLRIALRRRNAFYVILGTFVLLVLTTAFYFGSSPRLIFFPSGDPKYINVLIELPLGTDIKATDSAIQKVEDKVYELIEPDQQIVKSVLTNVGKGAVSQNEGFSGRGGGPNRAMITVSFVNYEDRKGRSSADVLKRLGDSLIGRFPGMLVSVEKQNEGPPVGKPINIEISGRNFDKLLSITDTLTTLVEASGIQGIEGLQIDLDVGKPELRVTIDRERARRFGLSTGQVASTIRTALFGSEVSSFKVGEDEYPIQLRMKDEYRYNLATLLNQSITFRDQASGRIVKVPISAVADVQLTSTYGAINRINRERIITLYSNVLEGFNPTQINNQIRAVLDQYDFPDGYRYSFTGEQQEQAESMGFLFNALIIAVAIILLILVGQFNSLVKPIIIMVTVLLSTIGVFGGLATFKMEFVVIMTGIGIVSLAGVVVNNGIVLIDYINLLRNKRKLELGLKLTDDLPRDESLKQIIDAGRTRLRPVLLTAITTILGLFPLAIGINIDFLSLFENFDPKIYFGGDNAMFWSPMSWTVIFGLSFATFLTLVLVPAMYHALHIVKLKFKRFVAHFKASKIA
jgi:multidrug efflux pump subunit AcrB